jgi:hypothetical protein
MEGMISEIKGGPKGRLIRRLAHGMLPLGIIYYWLPDPLYLDYFPKWLGALIVLLGIAIFESVRIMTGRILPGMRNYEVKGIGSYFYAVLGVILLLLFFHQYIAIPCILAMAWVDPLAGELRLKKIPKSVCIILCGILYFIIILISSVVFNGEWFMESTIILSLSLAAITTPIALFVEAIYIRHLDDDFTMLFFPALAVQIVFLIIM